MNEIIKAEIKKLTKKMKATTEMESHNYYRGKIAGIKLAIRLEPLVRGKFAELLEEIPTNWLDPLLTGKDAILKGYEYTPKEIEKLLKALKDRLELKVSKFSRQHIAA
jgi:hypothetical protein